MRCKAKKLFTCTLSILILLAVFAGCAGQSAPASTQTAPVGQVDDSSSTVQTSIHTNEVFDVSQDAGLLTARFLRMDSETDEKTGDSIILTSPDGKTMLIDAGTPAAGSQVVALLREMGITKLDYVMVTHPHIDHLGGMPAVFDAFEVGEIYATQLYHTTNAYNAYIAAVEEHGIPVTYLNEGSKLMFGSKVEMLFYGPEPDIEYYDGYPEKGTAFMNDRSLVVKFVYDEVSMLFTGDIYTAREGEIVGKYGEELNATLLKMPHHGDETSNSKAFINAVSPSVAVATYNSVASMSVLNRYKKMGIEVYSTFLNENVKASTDGKTLTMLTQTEPA